MSVKPFHLEEIDIKNYYYIAHLFDRILIGKEGESTHHELIEAIRNDEILEVHFFNEKKEIYAARVNGKLMVYEPLEHRQVEKEKVILRSYRLEEKRRVKYDTLEVKEYIEYDTDNLAYVDRTVLYQLVKRGKKNESCEG